jgi:hypothetical protein
MGPDLKQIEAVLYELLSLKLLIFLKLGFCPCFRLDGLCKLRKFYAVLIKVLLFVVTCVMSQL